MKALRSRPWACVPFLIIVSAFSPTSISNRKSVGKVGQTSHLCMDNESGTSSRADFIKRSFVAVAPVFLPIGSNNLITLQRANAFDGGVGGLGKTRPQTGVVFRDDTAGATSTSSDDRTNELIAPDGTPAFVTFSSPWPQSKSAAGIEARDISAGYESAYVQVAELPNGATTINDVKPAFLSQIIFNSSGKFGMYGSPTDIKIKKVVTPDSGTTIFLATFTTLTPAMRESDRKAYISASIVGNGLFLLVTTTTSTRFNKLEGTLRKVADSFTAIPAPKSNLRK